MSRQPVKNALNWLLPLLPSLPKPLAASANLLAAAASGNHNILKSLMIFYLMTFGTIFQNFIQQKQIVRAVCSSLRDVYKKTRGHAPKFPPFLSYETQTSGWFPR